VESKSQTTSGGRGRLVFAGDKILSATVWLHVDNLARSAGWMLRLPFFRYMRPADILYHEVGHHIHTAHKPIHEEREDVAQGIEP